ncbi:MAG: hypothetical protein RIS75_1124 [Actinomycetota bacterium]|jgi:ABC-2 type transport system ATP-binding protein
MSIRLEHASIGHSGRPLLDNFNLSVGPGSTTALVGPNGSGKTTVVNSLLGLTPLLTGNASLNGSQMSDVAVRRQVGVVWQDRGLPQGISVFRWVRHLADLYQTPIDMNLVEALGIELVKRPLRQLSGGEQQRIAIWSALNHQPLILVMDEPTVGLDEATRNTFYEMVRDRISQGACALLTSHYAQDVSALADDVISIGNKESTTSTSAIFTTSAPLVIEAVEIQDVEISQSGNGYVISSSSISDLLGIASSVAAAQNVTIRSFTVITNG